MDPMGCKDQTTIEDTFKFPMNGSFLEFSFQAMLIPYWDVKYAINPNGKAHNPNEEVDYV